MNKSELLSKIASGTGLTKDQVNSVLNKYNAIAVERLSEDKEFVVMELGKIKVVKRAERKAFNPSTREPIVIPATDAPKFVFSKKIKEQVANSGKK